MIRNLTLMKKNEDKNWEIEFDKKFIDKVDKAMISKIMLKPDIIKSFIRNLLASQKDKIEEEGKSELKKLQDRTAWNEDYKEEIKDREFKVKKLDLKNRNYFSNQAAEEVFETINEIIDYLARTRSH